MATIFPSEDVDLESMAQDGEMDYSKWPALLERVIPRLEHIVYNEFPTPSIPLPGTPPHSLRRVDSPATKNISPERDEPPEKKIKLDPVEDDNVYQASKEGDSLPVSEINRSSAATSALDLPKEALPPLLQTLLHTIIATLRSSFPTSPPHTSQRLAELLLTPRKHYQTLPSFLRALDRIVSVASPASIFPLKNLAANSLSINGALLNGISSPSPDPAEDVDFIGGAELTEIPWAPKPQPVDSTTEALPTTAPATMNGAHTNASDLRTESTSLVEGPNGLGGVETVTVTNGSATSQQPIPREHIQTTATTSSSDPTPQHGITQGELLRQEQEAGIVPVPSPAHSHSIQTGSGPNSSRVTRGTAAAAAAASEATSRSETDDIDDILDTEVPTPEEEMVHARGPGIIGMEDMGPQQPGSGLQGGIDVEGALGRRGEIMLPAEDGTEVSSANSEGTGATQQLSGMELREEGWEVVGKAQEQAPSRSDQSEEGGDGLGEKGQGVEGDDMNIDAEGEIDDELVAEAVDATTAA